MAIIITNPFKIPILSLPTSDAAGTKKDQITIATAALEEPATERYAEAYETFWSLGLDWWKQLFDGKYQQYGPEVFDKGLHGREIEPGFYQDALKACRWV